MSTASHTEQLAAVRAGASTPTSSQQQQLLDDIRTIVEETLVKKMSDYGVTAEAPPHIIVTCDADSLVFGRYALLQMNYDTALDTFFDEFLEDHDDIKLNGKMMVTFWRKYGDADSVPVRMHPSSWNELIPNVTQIRLIIDVDD